MSTQAAQPVVPPRPARSQNLEVTPKVPPRPSNRKDDGRSVSPNPQRFAPSPLHEGLSKTPKTLRFSPDTEDHEEDSNAVNMPSVGEEGMEYAAIPSDVQVASDEEGEKRTVGDDIELAAPKPELSAQSAKDRVANVTHIGKSPSTGERSLKKKASTTSQLTDDDVESDRGIPQIGQRAPMLPGAGDVQAPSPAPGPASTGNDSLKPRHHGRKTSARGFVDLPPGSYGLHGHGIAPKDKLDKEYYEKHPELLKKEKGAKRHEHDRATDFSLPSDQLNSIVRKTVQKPEGIPDEEIGFQAHEAYASRISRPASTVPPTPGLEDEAESPVSGGESIHIKHENIGEKDADEAKQESAPYDAPILAADEVARHPEQYEEKPAVKPPAERAGSAYEIEEPKSRPSSRPTSTYIPTIEVKPTPLEDVEEYEPLFPDDDKAAADDSKPKEQSKQRFPSKDVWEDAPNSVHVTAEVSTPEPTDGNMDNYFGGGALPTRSPKPPTSESKVAGDVAPPKSWVERQLNIRDSTAQEPQRRFPSRDVWEDVPDSHNLETTVDGPQEEQDHDEAESSEVTKPQVPARPAKSFKEVPDVPERPKVKPQVPDKPKPAVPSRPAMGGKIAALQAGFMSDLNKRLQLGPQAPKKEEPSAEDLTEVKEKAPLADARKSRARGPQRRAPASAAAKSPAPAAAVADATADVSTLSFSTTQMVWSIEPEEGSVSVVGEPESEEKVVSAVPAAAEEAEADAQESVKVAED